MVIDGKVEGTLSSDDVDFQSAEYQPILGARPSVEVSSNASQESRGESARGDILKRKREEENTRSIFLYYFCTNIIFFVISFIFLHFFYL
jgi:hypothetical protein